MSSVDLPSRIVLNDRIFNDIQVMMEYARTSDKEVGGFLVIAGHGNLGVIAEQFGEDREVTLQPNEELHESEVLVGTFHAHPLTNTGSTGDVTGYLRDENERVMAVSGADESINFFFKLPVTEEGDFEEVIAEQFNQEDMNAMAQVFNFVWYRASKEDRTILSLQTTGLEDSTISGIDEEWPIESLIQGLGIEGQPDFPDEYSTGSVKKTPRT